MTEKQCSTTIFGYTRRIKRNVAHQHKSVAQCPEQQNAGKNLYLALVFEEGSAFGECRTIYFGDRHHYSTSTLPIEDLLNIQK
jgi:hypothetical protein